MLKIDDRQIDRLEKDLKRLKKRALIPATQDALNDVAFDAMREAKRNITRKMTTRTKWTVNNTALDKATFQDLRSRVGSRLDYMKEQEEGGVRRSKGKHGASMYTNEAAGQKGDGARTKTVNPHNYLTKISLNRAHGKRRGKSRRQRNLMAVKRAAAKGGSKFVFLDMGKKKGIYKIKGSEKNPLPRKMVDLSKKAIVIKPRPWLEPAADKARKKMPSFYAKRLEIQLRRAGIFRG